MQYSADQPEDRSEEEVALSLMQAALEKLDNARAPGHIGAHLDLAIEQLREHVAGRAEGQLTQIDRAAG